MIRIPLTPSPSYPLSLWERVGVRVSGASSVGNGREGTSAGYWGALTRPSATLSQRERVLFRTLPAREAGVCFVTFGFFWQVSGQCGPL